MSVASKCAAGTGLNLVLVAEVWEEENHDICEASEVCVVSPFAPEGAVACVACFALALEMAATLM